MKRLRYQVMGYTIIYNEETQQNEQHEAPATIEQPWSERAEQYARQVALGAVEIYDDGEEIDISTTGLENRVTALEENDAAINEALDMLLSGVTGDE